MGYGFSIDVRGELALFTRVDLKVERVSYDVITPSAARAIIESIYWKPAIKFFIDTIHVYNEPQFTNIRRNEVSQKISHHDISKLMEGKGGKGYLNTKEIIQQRASTVLRDVHYAITGHFEMTGKKNENEDECEEKHYNILLRRLRNGQCFTQPYLGCKEFPAIVTLIEGEVPESPLTGERDLGYMLYDMEWGSDGRNGNEDEIVPTFFRARMVNGVINLGEARIVR
ncbi:MAG: type I-C CRISPR-associated protein Cas5c [Lachnospiraceae bacterium]